MLAEATPEGRVRQGGEVADLRDTVVGERLLNLRPDSP